MQQAPNIKNNSLTLLLLCLGYFIDFYDLTIMGVSYNELLREQFNILDQTTIQQTYLLISNCQTIGIFIGAITFGIIGDKIGRVAAIRYSILLYSFSTIAAVFTHSLPLFITFRILAYIGLATEFSTSTVLILELFKAKSAAWGTAILYSFGVLGGLLATSIGFVSWRAMFLFGGIAGILLYLARSHIQESEKFLSAKANSILQPSNQKEVFLTKHHIKLILAYFAMMLPFYLVITSMFIFPNFIIKEYTPSYAIKILLLGFFIGNIISSLLSAFFVNHKKSFVFICLVLFIILSNIYQLIPENALLLFSLALGLIGGGYPIVVTQMTAQSFPIMVRSTACNLLTALGRASSIFFNTCLALWIAKPEVFINNSHILAVVIFMVSAGSLLYLKLTKPKL